MSYTQQNTEHGIFEAQCQIAALVKRVEKLEQIVAAHNNNGIYINTYDHSQSQECDPDNENKKIKRAKLFSDECSRLGISKYDWCKRVCVTGKNGCVENGLCMNKCTKRNGGGIKEGQRNMILVNDESGEVRIGKCCSSCIRASENKNVRKDGARYRCQHPFCQQEGVVALTDAHGHILPMSLSCGRHENQRHHRHLNINKDNEGNEGNESESDIIFSEGEIELFVNSFDPIQEDPPVSADKQNIAEDHVNTAEPAGPAYEQNDVKHKRKRKKKRKKSLDRESDERDTRKKRKAKRCKMQPCHGDASALDPCGAL